MKIKDINLPDGVFLAPMAGFTDRTMRLICGRSGARYVTTEMISAAAVYHGDKKTYNLARIAGGEPPCALQLFGSEPERMAYSAAKLLDVLDVGPCAIDINMGCPMKKIVRCGEGSALMNDPHRAEAIVRAVKRAVELPVTVKIRAGYSRSNKNAPAFSRMLQEAGADMICVHGRTREDMYTPGTVDLDVIRSVKQSVSIPVVANGDVASARQLEYVMRYTGCDGVAVGRGALGNPFVFEEITAHLHNIPYTQPTVRRRIETAKEHLHMLTADKGAVGLLEARGHIGRYTAGIAGCAAVRKRISCARTEEEMTAALDSVLAQLPDD